MQDLPNDDEQQWLLQAVADLITARGPQPFTVMPLVEPTRKFFPDDRTFSHRGLDRVIRRLMQYAGLGHLDVDVATYRQTEAEGWGWDRRRIRSIAGMFMGIEKNRCLFGFNELAADDAEAMVGVMAHEVAHAYRAVHRLAGSTARAEDEGADEGEQEEELLTDVTAVYLGFGILATNNSYRFRTEGSAHHHAWSTQATGYLPPQAFAFLLAAQMIARDLAERERNRLLRHLEPNQAGFTKAAYRDMTQRDREILEALRLWPRAGANARIRLEELQRPLPAYVRPAAPADHATGETAHPASTHPVFRIRKDRAASYALVLAFILFVAGTAATLAAYETALGALAGVAGFMVGVALGRRVRWDVCSDPACESVLPPAATHCPTCGGCIAGRIKRASERLKAEDEYARGRRTASGE